MENTPNNQPTPQSGTPAPVPQAAPVAPAAPVVAQPAVVQPAPVVAQPSATPAAQPAAPAQKDQKLKLTPEEEKALKAKKAKAKKKRAIIAGIVTASIVFVVIIVTVFLLLTQGGGSQNPLLKMFGISEENFYPFLISITNIVFGLAIFITFIVAVIGLFKTSMAKKDDKPGKTKGIMMTVIGGVFFLFLAFGWTFTYMYLSSKQVAEQEAQDTSVIITNPEELTNLTAPMTIEFDASQIPFNEYKYKIISYAWDFGDGANATGAVTSHRYTEKGPDSGRYQVTLTLTYQDLGTGEEAQDQLTLDVVFSNEQVSAMFTADPTEGEIPLDVSFDASESMDPDGEIVAYDWDFNGDGQYDDASGVTANYTYEKAGGYMASLRVTDNSGEYSTYDVDITATSELSPTAVVTETNDGEYYAGVEYSFSAIESSSPNGEIEKYTWDFGDETAAVKTRTADHTFEKAGTYIVKLTVTDETDVEGETTLEIEVLEPSQKPVAVITTVPAVTVAAGAIMGDVPFTVAFSASESTDADENIVDYEWDFDGDGVVDDTGETTTNTYEETGTYTVGLKVIDADGNEDSETVIVVVEAQNLNATLSATPVSGEVPLEVEFSAAGSSYPDGEIVAYEWDFGDGTSEYVSGAEVSYEYDSVGTFTATVTVVASDGTEDTSSMSIVVRPVSLTACFEASMIEGASPLIATFDPNCSEGSVESYTWDFGDGNKSYDRKPTHTFSTVGVYTVKLKVEDTDGVSDSYEMTVTVTE
jgi:PKD repeat protein